MSDDGEDEVFDEGELADGFEEEIIEQEIQTIFAS